MKNLSFIFSLALILSAFTFTASAQTDRPNETFNPQTYQWETANQPPNIDSIATAVLLNALTVWDQPELYQEAGFIKVGDEVSNTDLSSMIAVNKKTLVQIDRFSDTTAEVYILYSGWSGHWKYLIDNEGYWSETSKDYSNLLIPQIDEWVNPFIQSINTARLKSELAWLQGPEFTSIVDSLSRISHSMEQRSKEIQSLWQTEGDYMVDDIASDLDTTIMDSDSTLWHITYSTNPSITWEYEAEMDPTSMLVYHFDENGQCISALNFITEVEFIEEKIETTNGILRIERLKMSFKMSEIQCLDLPPISFEKTGLKK